MEYRSDPRQHKGATDSRSGDHCPDIKGLFGQMNINQNVSLRAGRLAQVVAAFHLGQEGDG